MIRPLRLCLIYGRTAEHTFVIPMKLVSICQRFSSMEASSKAPPIPAPALLISTSIRPAIRKTASTALRTDSTSVTSIRNIHTPSSRCPSCTVLPVPKTLCPLAASMEDAVFPNPDVAPVNSITLDTFTSYLHLSAKNTKSQHIHDIFSENRLQYRQLHTNC